MPAAPSSAVPQRFLSCLAVVDFVPLGDGTFKIVLRKPIQMASVSTAVRVTGVEKATIYRLYHAGFIAGMQPTPKKILINLSSLYAHIEATKDEDFWTPERKLRFEQSRDRAAR